MDLTNFLLKTLNDPNSTNVIIIKSNINDYKMVNQLNESTNSTIKSDQSTNPPSSKLDQKKADLSTTKLNKSIKTDEPADLSIKLDKSNFDDKSISDDELNYNNFNNLVLKLDWKINSKIINLLNELKNLILNNSEKNLVKDELVKNKDDLIKTLTELPIKLNEFNKSNLESTCKLIDNKFRFEIINQLIKNYYMIFEYQNVLDNKQENELIEENTNFIFNLISLPQMDLTNSYITDSDDFDDLYDTTINSDDLLNNKRKLDDTEGEFGKEIDFNLKKLKESDDIREFNDTDNSRLFKYKNLILDLPLNFEVIPLGIFKN